MTDSHRNSTEDDYQHDALLITFSLPAHFHSKTCLHKEFQDTIYQKEAILCNLCTSLYFVFTGYSKPFNIRVHTDATEGSSSPAEASNRGFCFTYVQQPCNSSTGKWFHVFWPSIRKMLYFYCLHWFALQVILNPFKFEYTLMALKAVLLLLNLLIEDFVLIMCNNLVTHLLDRCYSKCFFSKVVWLKWVHE